MLLYLRSKRVTRANKRVSIGGRSLSLCQLTVKNTPCVKIRPLSSKVSIINVGAGRINRLLPRLEVKGLGDKCIFVIY